MHHTAYVIAKNRSDAEEFAVYDGIDFDTKRQAFGELKRYHKGHKVFRVEVQAHAYEEFPRPGSDDVPKVRQEAQEEVS